MGKTAWYCIPWNIVYHSIILYIVLYGNRIIYICVYGFNTVIRWLGWFGAHWRQFCGHTVRSKCHTDINACRGVENQKNTKTAIHIKLLFRRSTRCYLKLSIAIYSYLLDIFYNQLSCWASLLLDLPVITGCGLADEGLNKIGSCDLRHGGQQQSKLLGGWAILAQKNVNLENRDKKPMTY